MKKRILVGVFAISLFLNLSVIASAAEEKDTTNPAIPAPSTAPKKPVAQTPGLSQVPVRSAFGMIVGTLTKIDTTDPANVKLEVKSDRDNTIHVISIMPWTNITKISDVSDLKTGEAVRIMVRNIDTKETAMGVMFGKIKPVAAPKQLGEGAPAPGQAPAQTKQQDRTKK